MKTTDPIPTTATQDDIDDRQPERRGLSRRAFLGGLLSAAVLTACGDNLSAKPAPSEGQTPVDQNGEGQDTGDTGADTAEPTDTKEFNKADAVDELLETSTETPEPLDGEKYGSVTGGPDGWEITETNDGVKKYVEAFVSQLNDWMKSAALRDGWDPTDEPDNQVPPLVENDDRAIEAIFGTLNDRKFSNSHVIYEQTEAMIESFKMLHTFIVAYRFGSLQAGIEQFQPTFKLESFEEVSDLAIVKGGLFQLAIEGNNAQYVDALKQSAIEGCGIDLEKPFAIGGVVRPPDTDGSDDTPLQEVAYASMFAPAEEIDKMRYHSS